MSSKCYYNIKSFLNNKKHFNVIKTISLVRILIKAHVKKIKLDNEVLIHKNYHNNKLYFIIPYMRSCRR